MREGRILGVGIAGLGKARVMNGELANAGRVHRVVEIAREGEREVSVLGGIVGRQEASTSSAAVVAAVSRRRPMHERRVTGKGKV